MINHYLLPDWKVYFVTGSAGGQFFDMDEGVEYGSYVKITEVKQFFYY